MCYLLSLGLLLMPGYAAAQFLIKPAELEAVYDQAMAQGLDHMRFAGAVVTVVRDGEILFNKGYGFQNLENRIPVDPDATLFRVASVTKTVTSTAISQLLEQGVISSIDEPANRYLKRMQLPEWHGKSVTIKHLLTHSAGFEDRTDGAYASGTDYPAWSSEYLARQTPAIVRPPDYASVYSNAGVGILGVMISDLSGQTFSDYVQTHIFDPAGMKTAVILDHPGPVANLVTGYSFFPSGEITPLSSNHANSPLIVPAGAMAASGNDMARYMIALMGGSNSKGIPPLIHSADLAASRFSPLAGNHPAVSAFGYLYFLRSWNGEQLAEHSGYTYGNRSIMTLLPEHRLGILISVTGESGISFPFERLRDYIAGTGRSKPDAELDWQRPRTLSQLRALGLEALLGPRQLEIQTQSDFSPEAVRLEDYVGDYQSARRNDATLLKVFTTLTQRNNMPVRLGMEGSLKIGGLDGYKPVAPGVFHLDPASHPEPGSGWLDTYAFKQREDGSIEYLTYGYGEVIFEPISGVDNPITLRSIFNGAAIILLTGLLAFLWPNKARGKWWAALMAMLVILLPVTFFASMAPASEAAYSFQLTRGQDYLPFVLMANLTWLLALLSLPVAVYAWKQPAGHWRQWFQRGHATVLLIGCMLLIVFAWNTALIGIHLP